MLLSPVDVAPPLEKIPMAVLLSPVEIAPAEAPMAVLFTPVLIDPRASLPTAVFEVPVTMAPPEL